MARLFLLDANIISALLKQPQGIVAEHIARVGPDNVCTSIIVSCEVRYGLVKKHAAALTQKADALFAILPVKAMDASVEAEYAMIRVALEKQGTPIGANDLFIAAHARSLGAVCVTDNEAEFRRVPGLVVENWLRRTP